MKLEVGMYVRYKYENFIYIGKIKFISEVMGFDETLLLDIDNCIEEIYKENIIKASHNIIDLIEEGDIIQWEIIEPYRDSGINEVISRFSDELGIYQIEADRLLPLKDMTIKSIVTKEQFEAMQYEVK